ncbi:MAG: helix-turn-helix domain-containing protein [Chitinophagaceae bacterium]
MPDTIQSKEKYDQASYLENTSLTINYFEMKTTEENTSLHKNCHIRHVLDRLGDKWSILIVTMLGEEEKLRFNEISNRIGDISQKMLTVTLRSLEADGLVTRQFYAEIPPRVEYALTDLGRSLLPLIEGLAEWAMKNLEAILKNRENYNARTSCTEKDC